MPVIVAAAVIGGMIVIVRRVRGTLRRRSGFPGSVSTARMDVGSAGVATIPAPTSAIQPTAVTNPGTVTVDHRAAAPSSGAEAAGPGELQAD